MGSLYLFMQGAGLDECFIFTDAATEVRLRIAFLFKYMRPL